MRARSRDASVAVRIVLACALALFAFVATARRAEASETCRTLPRVAWDNHFDVDVSLLGLAAVGVKTPASVKELYTKALCGIYPDRFDGIVARGESAVLEVPANVATSLDSLTPYFPRVDWVYVRGGGPGRELVVFLFANGYEGDFFVVDEPRVWKRDDISHAAAFFDVLPYEFVRRAATQVNDFAKYQNCLSVNPVLKVLFGLVKIDLGTHTIVDTCGRGLTSPFGTVFAPEASVAKNADFWIHEIFDF